MKIPVFYALLLSLLVLARPGWASARALPGPARSLAEALNPDGTLRPGATGSFAVCPYRMRTAPDGRPVFRPVGAGDERWTDGFGVPGNGLDNRVDVLAIDGTGAVYAGGEFTTAGGVAANHVAKWNGTAWSSLGTGAANGVTATGVPLFTGNVSALAIGPNGSVYVGGQFTHAGGVPANNVAKWDGTAWSSLGPGVGSSTTASLVRALAVAGNGDVYAAGEFTLAGGLPANRVARWNGAAWGPLGSGMDAAVNALVLAANGDLYAGGGFGLAGGVPASNVAKWNGTSWSGVGTGLNAGVLVLTAAGNGDVYAGGRFTQAGGAPANHVAKWDGAAWQSLGTGTANGVAAVVTGLALAGTGELYAGGDRLTPSYAPLYRWNGTSWSALGTGLNGAVGPLRTGATGKLYAGGTFTATGDGSKAMNYFGIYDPNAPLGTAAARGVPAAVFPNPAQRTATVRLVAGAVPTPLILVDAQGRVARRYAAPAGGTTTLDLRGLSAGIYWLHGAGSPLRLTVE